MKMKKSNRSRDVLLLVAYSALFVFTLVMEWVGIHDTTMRAVVNLSTLALVLLGGIVCFILYRKALADVNDSGEGTTDDEGGKDKTQRAGSGSREEEQEPVIDKDAYLAFAREKELTRRETEIAFLVVNGYSNQRIAQELYISEATVKKHLTHIYEKTGANGRKALKEAVIKK